MVDPQDEARREAERIAGELALLVAQEHRRANEEQANREALQSTTDRLSVLLAYALGELELERAERIRAEADARALSAEALGELRPMRYERARRGRRGRPMAAGPA
jgi:hypothetical protein